MSRKNLLLLVCIFCSIYAVAQTNYYYDSYHGKKIPLTLNENKVLVSISKDYDNKNYSSQYVLVLGEGKRYAIDNYILDPIYVAFLLIRESIIKTEDAELPHFTYVELTKLSDDQVQFLIKYVIDALGLASTDEIGYITQGGKSYNITQDYCFIQGHALESNIINRWPQLNAIAKGGGDNKLKNYILDTVCKDYPDFISTDFIELFNKIV